MIPPDPVRADSTSVLALGERPDVSDDFVPDRADAREELSPARQLREIAVRGVEPRALRPLCERVALCDVVGRGARGRLQARVDVAHGEAEQALGLGRDDDAGDVDLATRIAPTHRAPEAPVRLDRSVRAERRGPDPR